MWDVVEGLCIVFVNFFKFLVFGWGYLNIEKIFFCFYKMFLVK